MKCGMSEVQITPWLGCDIPGKLHRRTSAGVMDELYAKSLVVEDGEGCCAIIVIDCIDLKRYMVEGIRNRVSAHTTIAPERVMVSATHAHTAGPVKPGFVGEEDAEYILFMIRKSADAAILAYRRRRPAQIGFGRGQEADLSFNRRFFMKNGRVRTNPGIGNPDIVAAEGPIDQEVLVVRIDDEAGKPIGVLSNFALHPDTIGGELYSADYPGEISRQIKRALGSECVSLFLLGACGNINDVDVSGCLVKSPAHYRYIGAVLAAEVLKVREKISLSDGLVCRFALRHFPVRLREASAEQVDRAKKLLAGDVEGTNMERVMAEQIEKLVREGEDQNRIIELQAVALGELAIIGVPGELFVEFGLQIKAESPFAYTMINELCNASGVGYICTEKAHRNGGYEPYLTSTSRWPKETGAMIVEHVGSLLAQLRG